MEEFAEQLIEVSQIKKGMSILIPEAGFGLFSDCIFKRFKPSEINVHLVEENSVKVKFLLNKYYGAGNGDVMFYHTDNEYAYFMNDIKITKCDFMKFGKGFGDYNYDRVISWLPVSNEFLLHMFKLSRTGAIIVSPVGREIEPSSSFGKSEFIESDLQNQNNFRILKVTK